LHPRRTAIKKGHHATIATFLSPAALSASVDRYKQPPIRLLQKKVFIKDLIGG